MPIVSASIDAAEDMRDETGPEPTRLPELEARHIETLQSLHEAARNGPDHTQFVSRPIDKYGNPVGEATAPPNVEPDLDAVLERAHQKRVEQGRARSSIAMVEQMKGEEEQPAVAPPPSKLVTLRHELSSLCARLGELRANYTIQERALMAQVEAKAAQVAVAEEMSK